MAINLALLDDGTLDTVIEATCSLCGDTWELRYNPTPPEDDDETWDRVEDAFEMAEQDTEDGDCPNCRGVGIIPPWISQDLDMDDVRAINQGGCSSGAYMPSVTYHLALATMAEYGDNVLDYIQDAYGEIPAPDMADQSWSGLACYYLSMAVELWAATIVDE